MCVCACVYGIWICLSGCGLCAGVFQAYIIFRERRDKILCAKAVGSWRCDTGGCFDTRPNLLLSLLGSFDGISVSKSGKFDASDMKTYRTACSKSILKRHQITSIRRYLRRQITETLRPILEYKRENSHVSYCNIFSSSGVVSDSAWRCFSSNDFCRRLSVLLC